MKLKELLAENRLLGVGVSKSLKTDFIFVDVIKDPHRIPSLQRSSAINLKVSCAMMRKAHIA
jgi:hypothetical protein